MTSVSLRVEIAETQCSLTPGSDCRNSASDLSGNKVSPRVGLSALRRKIADFVMLGLLDQVDQIDSIGKVATL